MYNVAVFGASNKPERYSYKAADMLLSYGHSVSLVGLKKMKVLGLDILPFGTPLNDIHTITLYLNPDNQKPYYDYILSLRPQRILFNPGAENEELMQLAKQHDIQCEEACTLVLLSTGQF